MSYWSAQTFVAEWASILALLASGYAALTVKKIRADMMARVRLPDLVSAIDRHASEIVRAMPGFDTDEGRAAVAAVLARCVPDLEAVIARGADAARVRALIDRIDVCRNGSLRGKKAKDEVWAIWASLAGVLTALNNLIQDRYVGG
jgi:hypothetical protein